jgi:hypothetical protein
MIWFGREPPTDDDIRDMIATKLLKFPRFHALAVETKTVFGRATTWAPIDPSLILNDLSKFVKRVPRKPHSTLMSTVEPLLNHFWDPNLPLWRLYIVDPLPGPTSADLNTEPNDSDEGFERYPAFVLEINHAIGDGLSMVRLAMELLTNAKGEPFTIPEYKKVHNDMGGAQRSTGIVKRVNDSAKLGVSFLTSLWRQVLLTLWIADTPSNIKVSSLFYLAT